LIFFAITQFSKASNTDKEWWNYLILLHKIIIFYQKYIVADFNCRKPPQSSH